MTPTRFIIAAVMEAHGSLGNVAKVEEWLERCPSFSVAPTAPCFNVLIDAHAKRGDVARAEATHGKMQQQHVQANVMTYGAVLNACAVAGRIDRAEHWVAAMEKARVSPTRSSYNCLIKACVRNKEIQGAQRWLRRSVDAKCEPDIISLTMVMDVLARHGFWERALGVHELAQQAGACRRPDVVVFSTLIKASLQAKKARLMSAQLSAEIAERHFGEMIGLSIKPNAETLRVLRLVVGPERCRELCRDAGLYAPKILAEKRLKHHVVRPRHSTVQLKWELDRQQEDWAELRSRSASEKAR